MMMTNICFGLTCLLIPLTVAMLRLQSGLHISSFDHTLVEILILCAFIWLMLQILRLDERLYYRWLSQQKHDPSVRNRMYGQTEDSAPIRPLSTNLKATEQEKTVKVEDRSL